MLFHLPKLREHTLSSFNQQSTLGHLSTTDLDFAINEAFMSRAIDLIIAGEGYFEESFSIDLVANQESYALPKNFVAGQKEFVKATRLERLIGSRWFPLEFKKRYSGGVNSYGTAQGDGYFPTYNFRGRALILEPPPASSESGTTRLIYAFQPPRLNSGNCGAGASTTGAESQVILASTADPRDDYYNGARVTISSGTCDAVGQTRMITDYNGYTKVATLDSAWSIKTVVANTNPKAADVYSILIHDDFPEIFHELIALDACMSGYLRERTSSATMSDFAKNRQLVLAEKFMSLIENRSDSPKFTTPWQMELE